MSDLMKFDPATGLRNPYPSEPEQYRGHHGRTAWLFNPYTGDRRDARDVGSDTFGHLIKAPDTAPLSRCAADRDGECRHAKCPQIRDNEPARSGRHCPIDVESQS